MDWHEQSGHLILCFIVKDRASRFYRSLVYFKGTDLRLVKLGTHANDRSSVRRVYVLIRIFTPLSTCHLVVVYAHPVDA